MDILAGRFSESKIFIKKAYKAWLIDEEGKKYVDYLLGNCCQILGHSHPRVIESISKQLELCMNIGDHNHKLAYNLAEKILKLAGKEALRFVNSGSEAVHLALRLARAYTGRPLILKFDGHYHGWFTEEIMKFVPNIPYKKGLLPEYSSSFINLPWNDKTAVENFFAENSHNIAAVICEPLCCHAGPIPPVDDFLQFLRDITLNYGALLIFDECITGFRLAPGGAQEYYDVPADVVTYSKALSAGLPLGVCAGIKPVMELLEGGSVYQAATYDANPVSLSAANVVIDIILEEKPHERIFSYGRKLIEGIDYLYTKYNLPHIHQGCPAVFQFFLTNLDRIKNHREALSQTDIVFYSKLVDRLLVNGVNLYKGDLRKDPDSSWLSQWFICSEHDDSTLDFTLDALDKSLGEVLENYEYRVFK
jgi:glutamate-1-semialdehyde 2,1-aminomutase